MSRPAVNAGKPIICTFRQLARATLALHQGERRYMDTLHDVWKLGAPTPNSRIMRPKNYDERLRQRGNYEARIVFPTALAKWIIDVATARGIPIDAALAFSMAAGDDVDFQKRIQISVGTKGSTR